MRKITNNLLLFTVLLCFGCGNKNIIDDERSFAAGVWNRFTPEVFEVVVTNTDDYYNMEFTATVDTALFRYSTLPVTVNIYSPAGERRTFHTAVILKENGRWKGQANGGMREVTTQVRTFFSFNSKGPHRMEIAQATSQYDLEGIASFRLTIENTKIDYSDL